MWKMFTNLDDSQIYGIELTYSSECCGNADIVHMYGSRTGILYSVSITQKVKEVRLMYWIFHGDFYNYYLRDIWFTLADDSTAKTCNCPSSRCNSWLSLPINPNQSLVGLATIYFNALHISFWLDARHDLSIWIDNVASFSECQTLSYR